MTTLGELWKDSIIELYDPKYPMGSWMSKVGQTNDPIVVCYNNKILMDRSEDMVRSLPAKKPLIIVIVLSLLLWFIGLELISICILFFYFLKWCDSGALYFKELTCKEGYHYVYCNEKGNYIISKTITSTTIVHSEENKVFHMIDGYHNTMFPKNSPDFLYMIGEKMEEYSKKKNTWYEAFMNVRDDVYKHIFIHEFRLNDDVFESVVGDVLLSPKDVPETLVKKRVDAEVQKFFEK